jgi:(S)-ureidoglycine aminohydrolase
MKRIMLLALAVMPLIAVAQSTVLSKMYSWKTPTEEIANGLKETVLFKGAATDMEMVTMTSNALRGSSKTIESEVPKTEEYLLLIKDGSLEIAFNDSTWLLNGGSIALLMPGQKFTVKNNGKQECTFYTMKYRSKARSDEERGQVGGGSIVKQWDKIPFKPHDRGGIRNYFERPTAMCKRFEMHVTTLKEGIKSHEPHTHRAEEIVLIIDNKTEMQIDESFHKGAEGDIYYLGSNVSHAIRNDGKGNCMYFAFQFE